MKSRARALPSRFECERRPMVQMCFLCIPLTADGPQRATLLRKFYLPQRCHPINACGSKNLPISRRSLPTIFDRDASLVHLVNQSSNFT